MSAQTFVDRRVSAVFHCCDHRRFILGFLESIFNCCTMIQEEIAKSPSLKIAREAMMTLADLYSVLLQQALQFEPPVPLQISLHLG
ncbi:hypothetical protein ACSBR1_005957 [Camellia fascicularis]